MACWTSRARAAPRTVTGRKVAEVVTATLWTLPTERSHWSSRGMARASGSAPSTVQRIWKASSLQAHRSEVFKLSTDLLFVEKVRDILGLYLDPRDRIHDYKRHGTTSLSVALDLKAGTIIGKCIPRHHAAEFRRFLDMVEKNVPAYLDERVVTDSAASHKSKLIRGWFTWRAGQHARFTLTLASWINQIERFFGLLTDNQIRRSVHRSVRELEVAVTAYIQACNADPKPFRWVKPADDILAAVQRFCRRAAAIQDQCA